MREQVREVEVKRTHPPLAPVETAREAIAGLLTHEATTRWTAKDTLDSSWIQSSWEELGSLYSRIVLGRDSS